jgi:biopolymer transport protein ExbB/TolQ
VATAQLWLISFLNEFQKLPLLTQYAIIFLCVTGLIVHLFAYNEKTAHDGPTLFTTTGIFFTFVGIAEGLYGFDVSNIESSVPGLLSGLKTAFFASVVGVFIALSLKVRLLLQGLPDTAHRRSEGATIDDLVDSVAALQSAIAGSDDRSLISEIKLQRQAHNQETNNHIRQLSDRVSEQIAKLDLALEKELSKSISTLGSQLTSLSKQFVDDYAPLVDRLRAFTKATGAAI